MNKNTNDLDIQIEVRTIEIPVSEYRELIGKASKIDVVIRFAANNDSYDTRIFFKNVFAEEIQAEAARLHVKEDLNE
ncbi:hypothetical protein EI53_01881 [Fusobacterium naviforme]|nr:hypothetical protein F7P78_06845 [Fusobacterium naviforme]PSL09097.1 hypothetical protein EI53_01881 [Fusobacterium naviforme]STO27719.1 Uncharacterised protein [Fusobacterium naviforme]